MVAAVQIEDDVIWMRRAIRQAVASLGATWPNPGVGCTIVRDGVVLGEGRHEQCGGPHAEPNALRACRDQGHDPRGATAYMTLAPCTRQGRTPACTTALIEAGMARVVAALPDPNQDDAAQILAAAGIAYETGCCADHARAVHGGFLQRVRQGRPRITAKWAMTIDGFLAADTGHSQWISSPEALAYARRRRRVFDAIVVGAGTLRRDDPELRSRSSGRTPVRVVIAGEQDLPDAARLWASAEHDPVLVVTDGSVQPAVDGVETLTVPDRADIVGICTALGSHGFNEVLVEGGAAIHASFLAADCYDRIEQYVGGRTLAGGLPVAKGTGAERIDLGLGWQLEAAPRSIGDTVYTRWCREAAA